MNVVIVESPSKAKTINKYLGKDFIVLASYGHVRDLPSKEGSVDPTNDFDMTWETSSTSKKYLKEIEQAVKDADNLYLATDPDREGEAISWHVIEILNKKKALKDKKVHRVVFHEITKHAVLEAMENPRELNHELIEAYLARRALDYLMGFTLSPVLWRKLPGSRSAGRVQSVALRLIIEREAEIEKFNPQEYWTIEGTFTGEAKKPFKGKLTHLDGKKLDKFSLNNEKLAKDAVKEIERHVYHIHDIEKKQVKRNPAAPFITSTLQQEAFRKLGFSTSRTMTIAQKLYEGFNVNGETTGLITYMRTDSVHMATVAIHSCRDFIEQKYGSQYVPKSPRMYKTKAKNAQEAHEAIRPTNMHLHPDQLRGTLEPDFLKLYELIWKRAVASQMESAVLDQVGIDISSADTKVTFRATGSTIAFDGFLKLYVEGKDDDAEEEVEGILPPLKQDEGVEHKDITPEQHFTQPPPRYSEASLVKKLEELGIGRPSTYSSIIRVLQDRKYVRLEKKRFMPEDRGWIVTSFLENFFNRYVEYDFTAKLEDQLDEISTGKLEWKKVLEVFWKDLEQAVGDTKELNVTTVLEVLDRELSDHFFPKDVYPTRNCPKCKEGRLNLKLGKFGAFIGCTNYPECDLTQKIGMDEQEAQEETTESEYPKALGKDPETGMDISLRKGPYGFYVQLGEQEKGKKPKRTGLPKGMAAETVDLDKAIKLLSLPYLVGQHPRTQAPMQVGIGRYGPYIKHNNKFVSLKKDDIFDVSIEEAAKLVDDAETKPKKK